MAHRRLDRLNSLLTEVISDVIHQEVRNPKLPRLVTVTRVEATSDLSYAKVYISVIGTPEEKKTAVSVLQNAAGFIRTAASKQIVIRFFPELTFHIDESVEKQIHIEELIFKVQKERETRDTNSSNE